jgi:hypothetical protein
VFTGFNNRQAKHEKRPQWMPPVENPIDAHQKNSFKGLIMTR